MRKRRPLVASDQVPSFTTAQGLMDLAEQATIDRIERAKVKRQRDIQTRQRRLKIEIVGEAT
jgi:hypothetical protein